MLWERKQYTTTFKAGFYKIEEGNIRKTVFKLSKKNLTNNNLGRSLTWSISVWKVYITVGESITKLYWEMLMLFLHRIHFQCLQPQNCLKNATWFRIFWRQRFQPNYTSMELFFIYYFSSLFFERKRPISLVFFKELLTSSLTNLKNYSLMWITSARL